MALAAGPLAPTPPRPGSAATSAAICRPMTPKRVAQLLGRDARVRTSTVRETAWPRPSARSALTPSSVGRRRVSSDAARAVLRWAHDDAARRGVPLVVLRAWSITTAPAPRVVRAGLRAERGRVRGSGPRGDSQRDAARCAGAGPGVTVRCRSRFTGRPMTRWSRPRGTRRSSVVGARGRGWPALLGSVSTSVVRHAAGPVVVVPRRASAAPDVRPERTAAWTSTVIM